MKPCSVLFKTMRDVLRPYWTKYVIGAILRMRKGRKYPPDLAETIRRNPERRKVSCWNASSHSCPKSNCSRWNNRRSYGIHSSPFDPIDHKVCAALTDRSAPRESPGDLSEPWHGRSLRKNENGFQKVKAIRPESNLTAFVFCLCLPVDTPGITGSIRWQDGAWL